MVNSQEIIEFVKNDNRSQAEIFDSLKKRIEEKYDGTLTDEEAVEATQRFIGLFQTFVDMHDTKQINASEQTASLTQPMGLLE